MNGHSIVPNPDEIVNAALLAPTRDGRDPLFGPAQFNTPNNQFFLELALNSCIMPVATMRRSAAPTLQDVAREVGVSAMTVSVVLNGAKSATRVSDATRVRIQEAADRLNYRPNAVARGLSRRRMDTIGVVALVDGGELNLYFLEVLNGVLEAAAKEGQNTTIFSLTTWEGAESKIPQFCDGRVDGILIIGSNVTAALAAQVQRHTPFVTIHAKEPLPETYDLEVNDEEGAYQAVNYLISQGHRRILHLPGGEGWLGANRRVVGYRRALIEAGIPYNEALILPGRFSIYSGRERTEELLGPNGIDPLPTAIFCASDAIAYGCMEALAAHDLRVPDDISVVGFDDTLTARTTAPPLTTMRQPFRDMGHRAVELLLSQIREENPLSLSSDTMRPHTEVFEVELIIRGSVGPPPAAL